MYFTQHIYIYIFFRWWVGLGSDFFGFSFGSSVFCLFNNLFLPFLRGKGAWDLIVAILAPIHSIQNAGDNPAMESSYTASHFIVHKPGHLVIDCHMSHPGESSNTPSHFIV